MKRFFALVLMISMLMSVPALAIGRAIPQTSEVVDSYYIDCSELIGMTQEEVQAFLDERGRTLTDLRLQYRPYSKDDALVTGLSGFYGGGGGFGVYGLSCNLDFDGELSEEMIADGWVLTSRQFEGGMWYNHLQRDDLDGNTICSLYLQTNGFKIIYMEFNVFMISEYVAEKAAEKAAMEAAAE